MTSIDQHQERGPAEKRRLLAKNEIRQALIEVASNRQLITYGDLADRIHSIPISAGSNIFFDLLGEISESELKLGRGMLSALVINEEDNRPGKGFFDLSRSLGRLKNRQDKDAFWADEIALVYQQWRQDTQKTINKVNFLGK